MLRSLAPYRSTTRNGLQICGTSNRLKRVCRYLLDEGDGDSYADATGNGHDGVQAGLAFSGTSVEGTWGSAIEFGAVTHDDRIRISSVMPALTPLGTYPSQGTLEAWVRPGELACEDCDCSPIAVHIGTIAGDGFGATAETHLHATSDPEMGEYAWGFFTGYSGGDCSVVDGRPSRRHVLHRSGDVGAPSGF